MKLSEVFGFDRSKLNWPLGLTVAVAIFVPLVLLALVGQDVYWLSVSFGVLFVGLGDPGGRLATRAAYAAVFGVIGAVVTAWGIAVGSAGWVLVTLSTVVITLATGLVIRFGVRRFVTGSLLTAWFLIAISLPPGFGAAGITLNPWLQALAWLAGAAAWFVLSSIVTVMRRRPERDPLVAELPTDTKGGALTKPVVAYSVLRTLAVSGAVAIAFGFQLPYADWMPLAAQVAMKPDARQSRLAATQRVVGTALGAVIAIVFLLTVDQTYVLAGVMVLLALVGGAFRTANYALYTTGIAGTALIALDISDPTNLADEGLRILFTLIGVGIAIGVMALAAVIARPSAGRDASVEAQA
ncbi:FUSC family protein [Microbacterium sp. NPDC056044]|uniref:FUSC family protein n=1 Tax=Microbacterium sp. NPDC056044 TaxID=3345690 RepID=UPI0035DA4592